MKDLVYVFPRYLPLNYIARILLVNTFLAAVNGILNQCCKKLFFALASFCFEIFLDLSSRI